MAASSFSLCLWFFNWREEKIHHVRQWNRKSRDQRLTYLDEKLVVCVSVDTKSADMVEQLLWSHDIIHLLRLVEEVAHITTVSEEELQSFGMPRLN